MGYYCDSDSDDYVDLRWSNKTLSPEEEASIRAKIEEEARHLEAERLKLVGHYEQTDRELQARLEKLLWREFDHERSYDKSKTGQKLEAEGLACRDGKYYVWVGVWHPVSCWEDVQSILRILKHHPDHAVRLWFEELLAMADNSRDVIAARASLEKHLAATEKSRASIPADVARYVESRLAFHNLKP